MPTLGRVDAVTVVNRFRGADVVEITPWKTKHMLFLPVQAGSSIPSKLFWKLDHNVGALNSNNFPRWRSFGCRQLIQRVYPHACKVEQDSRLDRYGPGLCQTIFEYRLPAPMREVFKTDDLCIVPYRRTMIFRFQ